MYKEIHRQIHQLACTIHHLQKHQQRVWVSWQAIAKYQEGSEELAAVLSAQADLPEAKTYFTVKRDDKMVRLSEAGQRLAEQPIHQGLSTMQQVAGAVKRYARGLSRLRFTVKEIRIVGNSQKRYVHSVKVELGDTLVPGETPVNVVLTDYGRRVRGRIVGQNAEEGIMYVALESQVWPHELPAWLEIDRAFLLYQLAESIGALTKVPQLGRSILDLDETPGLHIAHEDSEQVALMLATLSTSWTRFLWGPPGAGKTYALARLTVELVRQRSGGKILLVAPSNVAVDIALAQFIEQLESSELVSRQA